MAKTATKPAPKKTPKNRRQTKPTARTPKGKRTATTNDAPAPASNGKATRPKLFDASPCAVIRWCRAQGWSFDKVRTALNGVGFDGVSDTTIRCQLAPNRKGEPAELSREQVKQLTDAAK